MKVQYNGNIKKRIEPFRFYKIFASEFVNQNFRITKFRSNKILSFVILQKNQLNCFLNKANWFNIVCLTFVAFRQCGHKQFCFC